MLQAWAVGPVVKPEDWLLWLPRDHVTGNKTYIFWLLANLPQHGKFINKALWVFL